MEADEAYYESPDILGYIRLTVMEWVRGFNLRVRVFAPQCPTRRICKTPGQYRVI